MKTFPLKFEVGIVKEKIEKDGDIEKTVTVLQIQMMTTMMKMKIGGIKDAGAKIVTVTIGRMTEG